MRGADHPRLGIGQEDRAAIGRGHANGEARRAGNDGVGARARVRLPGSLGDKDVGRVDLVGGEQTMRLDFERSRHARAIFGDIGRIIVRAKPAIEAGIEPGRYAALASEETVADAGKCKGCLLYTSRCV